MEGLYWKCIHVCLVILAYLHSGSSLTCLNCDSIAHPRLCTHVTKCFSGEKCGMETFISQDGEEQYKLGCVDTNTCSTSSMNSTSGGNQYFSCYQCCDDHDLCNVRGCSSTGFPANRGPICFNCEAFPEGYPCHKISHCETHEVCYNDASLEFQSDILYSSGCRSKHRCASETVDPIVSIGRRSVSVCADCCQGDLCNLQCRKSSACSDDSRCQLLMSSYDVCKSPDIAKQFCQKSCNLCATSGMTSCSDTRLDCAYISATGTVCGAIQAATTYGCLKHCGFCSGSTGGPDSVNSAYTTTSVSSNSIGYATSPQITPHRATTRTNSSQTTSVASTTTPELLQGGDHVIRGPDWVFGSQDGNGPGTVVNAHLGPGLVQVFWNNTGTTQSYRYGESGRYEVQIYTGKNQSTQPTTTTTTNIVQTTFATTSLSVGDKVIRGPDWMWQTQDGNSTGTVTAAPNGGWVTIKWDKTGIENSYRYGTAGKYDVKLHSGGTFPITHVSTPRTTQGPMVTRPATPSTTVTVPLSTQTRTLSVGDHVIPGRDWTWGDQNGNTTGVVTGTPGRGWLTVRWGNGFENSYRYEAGGAHDIEPVNKGYTPGAPSGTASSGTVLVGDVVIRGPNWNYANQDGNGTGRVVQVDNQSQGTWVRVQWKSGYENFYRYGAEGKYDVIKEITGTTSMLLTATTTANPYIFQVGDHVVRGPDWQWGNQDNGGMGTVIDVDTTGWVTVRWDYNFTNTYRNGVQNARDLQKVGSVTTTQKPQVTSIPPTAGSVLVADMFIGARVQRGKDWRYGSQDGNGPGTVGALPPTIPSGWVQVVWDNGYVNNYRLGKDNAYDIMFVPGSYNPPPSG